MFVQVVCLEAQLANTKAVAKEALTMLWEDAIALQGPSERPGENASIARILIKTITGWATIDHGVHLHCTMLPACNTTSGYDAQDMIVAKASQGLVPCTGPAKHGVCPQAYIIIERSVSGLMVSSQVSIRTYVWNIALNSR